MSTSKCISQSAFDGSRLRVILLVDLHEGAQQEFLDAYEHMRSHVASVPGHLSDQLCQSAENPSQWLITSEWAGAPPYLAWVNSEDHLETVKPMQNCVRDLRSMRYNILRETGHAAPLAPATADRFLSSPRTGDGVTRHALTFTIKPGSESKVAEILAGYAPPESRVDDSTRLRRTTLFMHGNRVVRTVEVQGDLMAALRHVSRQPEVRAVEEALNPYLELSRDLTDPASARAFFIRAAMPAVHHVTRGEPEPADLRRHALYYPAREGCGMALARLLSQQDETAADTPGSIVHRSTVFHRDDLVVRLVDVAGDPETDPVMALGIHGRRKAAVLARLLDGAALGVDGPLTSERDATRLLAHADMTLITDRRAPSSQS
ncbi:SchA/CurD-like domain-containing protein [Streptomyces sp. S.PNR 29]|uniref:SchA/CurD-like domain-containing protein n=1 Tax=Streptomyces sp. S.PNR 29 TaxID=2973805 RepID=UPI0025B0D378|nr:SchA/CurD-like domain-containing protein [Streptomyces sp. S.PNR 29]MDN0195825.1 antibiotic biosynthesis monooxygenase [Streptomyces sp. S.PNR 29]